MVNVTNKEIKPIHGKRTLVYITDINGTDSMITYAQDFSIRLDTQHEAVATVMGTDAVIDTETQGVLARISLTAYLSAPEVFSLLRTDFDDKLGDNEGVMLNYDQLIDKYISEGVIDSSVGRGVLNDSTMKFYLIDEKSENYDNINDMVKQGYIGTFKKVSVTSFELRGRKGEYVEVAIEGITGNFNINFAAT